jgi:hypothetical protein
MHIQSLFTTEIFIYEEMKIAITHFLLLKYNPSFEGKKCVDSLQKSFEALLRERYKLNHNQEADKRVKMWHLKQEIPSHLLTEEFNNYLQWMIEKRNLYSHGKEITWEKESEITDNVKGLFFLFGKLLTEFGYNYSLFLPFEIKVLKGDKPTWQEEGLALLNAVTPYVNKNPDILFNVTDDIIELAIRGFAKYWGISENGNLDIKSVIQNLEESEFPDASVTYSMHDPDTGNFETILPPLHTDLNQLRKNSLGFWSTEQLLHHHLDTVKELINTYSNRIHIRDFFKCLLDNFKLIREKMATEVPHLKMPNAIKSVELDWYSHEFTFDTDEDILSYGSAKEYEKHLKIYIVEVCGDIPEGTKIEFFSSKKNYVSI